MRAGVLELALIAALYVSYSLIRVVASHDLGAATSHALDVLRIETWLHLDAEHGINNLVADDRLLGVIASFYYASGHYIVTPVVLIWLWWRHPVRYRPARTALALATVAALIVYIALPTAPPRLIGGYHDVLAATANIGWWSTSASAPRGLGGLTNELAAMPSMHVGWALWCALTLTAYAGNTLAKTAGWAHVVMTTFVVIGTGNHWTLDAIAGAAVVCIAWTITARSTAGSIIRVRIAAFIMGNGR